MTTYFVIASIVLAWNPICNFPTKPGSSPYIEMNIDNVLTKAKLEDFTITRGEWDIEGGALVQTFTDYDGPDLDRIMIYKHLDAEFITISGDVTVTADGGASNYAIGILFKAKEAQNFYYVYLGQGGEVALAKFISPTWTLLHTQSFNALPIGSKRNLKIEMSENEISVFTDNVLRYTEQVQANEFETGAIGFLTGWGAAGKFENIIIATK